MRREAAVAALEAADEDVGLALPALGRRHQLPELVRLRRQRLLMWRCVWGSIQGQSWEDHEICDLRSRSRSGGLILI